LCFVKQYPKQNSIIHLKSNIIAPPQNFWAGYGTGCDRKNWFDCISNFLDILMQLFNKCI